jgi:hypothetical protein
MNCLTDVNRRVVQRLFFQDGEPALDLVEPGNLRRREANAIMATRASATDRPCNMPKQGVRKVRWTSNIF